MPASSTVAPGIFSSPGAEFGGCDDLRLHQPGRLVLGAQQPVLDALDREYRAADDEIREIARVLGHGVVVPLLTEFGDLGGFTGDDAGAGRVAFEDAALQDLGRTVGVAPGDQRHHFRPRGQARRHPEHPHGYHGAVLVDLEFFDQFGEDTRRWLPVDG